MLRRQETSSLESFSAASLGTGPLGSALANFRKRRHFDSELASRMWQFALRSGKPADSLIIDNHLSIHLSTDPARESAIEPVRLRTDSVDEFKSWVGADDVEIAADPIASSYWQLPGAPWSGRYVKDASRLTADERGDVEKAGWAYIFGDSRAVASYRPVIELINAPFEAAFYAVNKVTIRQGGQLSVTGAPAMLLFGELDIHSGGSLTIYTPCKAIIGRLEKVERPDNLLS